MSLNCDRAELFEITATAHDCVYVAEFGSKQTVSTGQKDSSRYVCSADPIPTDHKIFIKETTPKIDECFTILELHCSTRTELTDRIYA